MRAKWSSLSAKQKRIALSLSLPLAAISLIGLTGWQWQWWHALFVVQLAVLPWQWSRQQYNGLENGLVVANPFEVLRFDADNLYLGDEVFSRAKIKRLVLDEVEGKGLFQLPFNQRHAKVPQVLFDGEYLPQLRRMLSEQLPGVEVIT